MKKKRKTFSRKSTTLAIRMLERILKVKWHVTGTENLPNAPILYVINHFTRAETFLLPYVIAKYTGRHVRSLADERLFVGRFGDYLEQLDVISTKHEHRDRLMLGDLMTGRHDWAIYPEGTMVKSKKVQRRGRFLMTTSGDGHTPRTGAATLALKTEIYKRRYQRARLAGDHEIAEDIAERFGFMSAAELSTEETTIVPVTITYYPLRPGDNAIKTLVKKFFKEIPPRLEEELEIEGNIILSDADISIHFGEPIPVAPFTKERFFTSRLIPRFIRSIEKNNALLQYQAKRLTRTFMDRIYNNIAVNLDHLVCAGFRAIDGGEINEEHFRRAIYLTARDIRESRIHQLHETVSGDLSALLRGEDPPAYRSILDLAEEKGVANRRNGDLEIHRLQLEMLHMFHTIRVKNPFMVIANELENAKDVSETLKAHLRTDPDTLREDAMEAAHAADCKRYEREYRESYEEGVSKDRSVGAPYILRSTKSRIGIVLGHGFLSAPEEVRLLAEQLHESGFSVYAPRLSGHGTTPRDLATRTWEEWSDGYARGYSVLSQCCDSVYLAGFSTGGVLALRAGALPWKKVRGIVSISAPHDLGDIRARMAPAVNLWNEILAKVRVERGQIEMVQNTPENPDINYLQIPIRGLRQLDKLMDHTRALLGTIRRPVLLIHGKSDPAVDPKAVQKYQTALKHMSPQTRLLETENHIVIRTDSRFEITGLIADFIETAEASASAAKEKGGDPSRSNPLEWQEAS